MVKNLPANAGDVGSVPGLVRSPEGGNGNPLQYSCLDRGAWQATVYGVTRAGQDLATKPPREETDETRDASDILQLLKGTTTTG